MDNEKIRERQPDLVERADTIEVSTHAESKALESDESFHSGKIAFAQKVLGDRFEVLDVLGQGGMGAVYKVRDLATDRVVALKLLKPELCQDKTVLKRFQSEAAALAELDHPKIVSVYDHGITDDGAPFLTMQFLGSTTLTDYIKSKGKIAPQQSVEIALQICEALDYAHRRNVVHRDIKPSNVIVVEEVSDAIDNLNASHLSVQLVDFGIAKIIESSNNPTTNLTQTGDVFGTPAYMSPEQCEGQEVDHRSDVYSLGCLLYEMLSGRQPFQGANAIQVAVKHISGKPDRFADKYPEGHVLNSLEQIVLKCMRKSKSERYQSVAELKNDLTMTLAGKEVMYEAESEIEEAKKKRNSSLMNFGAFCSACLGVIHFLLYIAVLGVLFSGFYEVPGISDGDRAILIAFTILSVVLYAQTVFKTNYKKRESFAKWGDHFVYAALLASNIALIAVVTPPIQTSFPDAAAIFLTISFLSSWALICVSGVFDLFNRGVNLIKRLQDVSQKKTYVKPKPALIGPLKALLLHFGSATIFIIAVTFLFPVIASVVVAGFGNMYAKLGSSFAIPTYEYAVKLSPENVDAAENEAKLYTIRGDNEKAVKVLTAAINNSKTSAVLRLARAKAFHAIKLDAESLQDINLALKEVPNDSQLLEQRGLLYASQGAYADARRDYTSAITYADRSLGSDISSSYHSNRGLTYYAQQNYKEAINDFTKALEQSVYQGRERDFVRRALAHRAMGDPISATNDFKEAVQTYGSDKQAFLLKAFAAKNVGDLDGYQRLILQAEAQGAKPEDLTKYIFGDLPGVPKLIW